jgi:hypothetical protein
VPADPARDRVPYYEFLELSGFRVTDLFGDFDKSSYSADSPEMIFAAERRGDR